MRSTLCAIMVVLAATLAHAETRLAVKMAKSGGGRVTGGVAVVDASTGEIVDARLVKRRPWKAKLSVGPGTYHVLAGVAGLTRTRTGLSELFAVGDARKQRLRVPVADVVASAAAAPTSAPARPAAAGGAVATMGEVVVVTPGGTGSFDGPLLTVLFRVTKDGCELTWVETGRTFLDQRQRELDLQAQGQLDPSTPIRDALIPPTAHVEGSFLDADGQIAGELRLVDEASGRILVRRQFQGKSKKFHKLYVEWGNQFALDICGSLPTTTTSTTPGASTTTTTTLPEGGCTSDDDCGPCECCDLAGGFCTGTVGALQCCNLAGNPPTELVPGVCGAKQPDVCPSQATCSGPGATNYHCVTCADSGNIIEWYAPTGSTDPPMCARR